MEEEEEIEVILSNNDENVILNEELNKEIETPPINDYNNFDIYKFKKEVDKTFLQIKEIHSSTNFSSTTWEIGVEFNFFSDVLYSYLLLWSLAVDDRDHINTANTNIKFKKSMKKILILLNLVDEVPLDINIIDQISLSNIDTTGDTGSGRSLFQNQYYILCLVLGVFNCLEKCDDETYKDLSVNLNSILNICNNSCDYLIQWKKLKISISSACSMNKSNVSLSIFDYYRKEKYWENSETELLGKIREYFYHCFYKKGLRKNGGDLYILKENNKNQMTFSWVLYHENIFEYISNEDNWEGVHSHTIKSYFIGQKSGDCFKEVSKFFENFKSRMLPELKVDRNLLGFNNGIYNLKDLKFYPFDLRENDPDNQYSGNVKHLDPNFSTLNYFDQLFLDHSNIENHKDIKTPYHDEILKHQLFDEEKRNFFYMGMGRMFYPAKLYDNWEIAMGIFGFPGCGKSTLIRSVTHIYPKDSIGILSNNIERQWSLSNFLDKKIIISYELRNDLRMEQTDFLSLVSCEEQSVPRKYKKALLHTFDCPILVSGNKFISDWEDFGQLERRFLIFLFNQKIPTDKVRTDLTKFLKMEISSFIQKCARIYRNSSKIFGNQSIWDSKYMPESVLKDNQFVKRESNTFQTFFQENSIYIITGDINHQIEFNEISRAYDLWIKKKNYRGKKISEMSNTLSWSNFCSNNKIKDVEEEENYDETKINKRILKGILKTKRSLTTEDQPIENQSNNITNIGGIRNFLPNVSSHLSTPT